MNSEKSFGTIFSIVFLIVALYPLVNSKDIRIWAIIISTVLLATAYTIPKALSIPSKLWFKFGMLLGSIITHIVMALAYFITVLPTGLIMRLLGKALDDMLKMANQVNAKISFIIIPSPASVYGVQLHSDFSVYVDRHNKIVNEFRKRFKGVNIIDLNNELAMEIEKEFLYIDESDAHFNTYGTEVFFNIVSKKLNF
jgi:hypothetical protein